MKSIEVPKISADVAQLLDQARLDDLVVRLPDGSEFLLIALDEFDQEVAKTRANPRLMALLDARAAQSASTSLDEVKRQLQI